MSERTSAYFGGDRVTGPIRQLAANSFRELVEKFFNAPHSLSVTRQEFFSYDEETQRHTKDGPYVTACTFKEGVTKRNDANADTLVLVCLDLDTPEPGEHDYARDFFESPETVAEHLFPYNFVLYTTASHTPKAPRLRVIVEVDTQDVALHRRFVRHVAECLGITEEWSGHRESNVLSQPMYRPVKFVGSEFDAVLQSRTNGTALDEYDLPEEKSPESDDRVFAYEGNSDELSLLHLPTVGVEVGDVIEALKAIDPDCGYRPWYEIAAALRHQFRDEPDAQEAYHLFDSWSAEGTKYKGEKETYAKWKSFKPESTGKNPITIRTLFFHAQKAGWNPERMSSKLKKGFEDWLKVEDNAEFICCEGVKRIADLPFRHSVLEDTMIGKLQERIKVLSGTRPDKSSFRKEIDLYIARKKRSEVQEDNLPVWLRPWCFVTTQNAFRNVLNEEVLSPEAFDHTFSSELMASPDDEDANMSGRPTILPRHFALNTKDIKKVGGIIYDPRQGGSEPFFTWQGRDYLNTYRSADHPAEDRKNAAKAGELFCQHIHVLIGDKELERHVLDFLSYCVQKPGHKIPWAPVIQSGQGAGKTTLQKILSGVVGERNVKIITPPILRQNWNEWSYGSHIGILEEVHISGANREEIMNSLKQAISDDKVTVTKRFSDMQLFVNVTNYIGFTNCTDWGVLKDSDRRYLPIESPLQTKKQTDALVESGHFKKLAVLTDKWSGALRTWFLERPISPTFPVHGPAPWSKFRQQMIEDSKPNIQLKIEELIDGPDKLIGSDIIHSSHLHDSLATFQNTKRPTFYLKLLGYEPYARGDKFSINGLRTTIWVHRDHYDPDFGPADEILRERFRNYFDEIS